VHWSPIDVYQEYSIIGNQINQSYVPEKCNDKKFFVKCTTFQGATILIAGFGVDSYS
jgi:hypothetical protein